MNSQALNDLGLFAAVAVLSAAIFSLLVLPHLLPSKNAEKVITKSNFIDRLAAFNFSGNKYIQYGILSLTLIFIIISSRVTFDADMMKSNYMSKEVLHAEQNLNKVTTLSKKTIYLVTPGKAMDEALHANEKYAQLIVLT